MKIRIIHMIPPANYPERASLKPTRELKVGDIVEVKKSSIKDSKIVYTIEDENSEYAIQCILPCEYEEIPEMRIEEGGVKNSAKIFHNEVEVTVFISADNRLIITTDNKVELKIIAEEIFMYIGEPNK